MHTIFLTKDQRTDFSGGYYKNFSKIPPFLVIWDSENCLLSATHPQQPDVTQQSVQVLCLKNDWAILETDREE